MSEETPEEFEGIDLPEDPPKGSPEWKLKEGRELAEAEKKKLRKKLRERTEGEGMSRRSFLKYTPSALGLAWGLFAAGLGAGGITAGRFLKRNVTFEPPQVFHAGFPAEYEPGAVETRFMAEQRTWVVRTTEDAVNQQAGFYAIQAICTHLGCTPSWVPATETFQCPCHGSSYYKSGVNFEGPAPEPMARYAIDRGPDGMLRIDKSVEFGYEEWREPEAFLSIEEAGLA